MIILFTILMILVFGKVITIAIKATWGIVKICTWLIALPIALLVIAASGLFVVAIPLLAVIGIVGIFKPSFTR